MLCVRFIRLFFARKFHFSLIQFEVHLFSIYKHMHISNDSAILLKHSNIKTELEWNDVDAAEHT